MAKYRRYRNYNRRGRGRWAPNIVKIAEQYTATIGEFSNTVDLAVNPVQTSTGVSQVYTVKNFEITFTIETSNLASVGSLENITAYIMYVPQGMTITSSYYQEHPEYIMAYKYLGSPNTPDFLTTAQGTFQVIERQQFQPLRIRSRMSRKLQTGDRVVLFIQGSNESNNAYNYDIDGIVRWWTKAN